jgi:DNA-directed RNA polymerase subunit N (RpoN/RPB10)
MIIPIRCFTCGKTLADKWDWYEEEVKKLEKKMEEEAEKKGEDTTPEAKYFDKVRSGKILDQLGLTRYCCRRHMLGQVDMMRVI